MPELKVPQAPPGLPEGVNVTESPETGLPLTSFTVALTVEVLVPSAGTVDGFALAEKLFGDAYCPMLIAFGVAQFATVGVVVQAPLFPAVLDPPFASVAITVQKSVGRVEVPAPVVDEV